MAATPSPEVENLIAALRAERDAFRVFHRLLEEEAGALAAGDADALLAIAQRKSAQVAHLARLSGERNRLLRESTGLTDLPGLEAWQQRHDPAGAAAVRCLWQELMEAARAVRTLNEENGALIQLRLQHNQQALAVLMGAAREAGACYGPDGQPRPGTSGRPLGKA